MIGVRSDSCISARHFRLLDSGTVSRFSVTSWPGPCAQGLAGILPAILRELHHSISHQWDQDDHGFGEKNGAKSRVKEVSSHERQVKDIYLLYHRLKKSKEDEKVKPLEIEDKQDTLRSGGQEHHIEGETTKPPPSRDH